jgi:hypothetical protein
MKSGSEEISKYEFLVFMPESEVQGDMDKLRDTLIFELFIVWAVFFGIAALIFCILTSVIVWWISGKITKPIV